MSTAQIKITEEPQNSLISGYYTKKRFLSWGAAYTAAKWGLQFSSSKETSALPSKESKMFNQKKKTLEKEKITASKKRKDEEVKQNKLFWEEFKGMQGPMMQYPVSPVPSMYQKRIHRRQKIEEFKEKMMRQLFFIMHYDDEMLDEAVDVEFAEYHDPPVFVKNWLRDKVAANKLKHAENGNICSWLSVVKRAYFRSTVVDSYSSQTELNMLTVLESEHYCEDETCALSHLGTTFSRVDGFCIYNLVLPEHRILMFRVHGMRPTLLDEYMRDPSVFYRYAYATYDSEGNVVHVENHGNRRVRERTLDVLRKIDTSFVTVIHHSAGASHQEEQIGNVLRWEDITGEEASDFAWSEDVDEWTDVNMDRSRTPQPGDHESDDEGSTSTVMPEIVENFTPGILQESEEVPEPSGDSSAGELEIFDVADLLRTQNSDADIQPQYIESRDVKIPKTELRNDGRVLTVHFKDQLQGYLGRRNMIDEELKKIRHDTVANLLGPDTDVPFSKIDPNYSADTHQPWHNKTPDCWNPESRTILELGTTKATEERSLQKTYLAKNEKYAGMLVPSQVSKLYILIVSSRGVYTNMSLSLEVVDVLVSRFKMGISLETKLTKLLGRNIFLDTKMSHQVSIVRSVLQSIVVDPNQLENEEFPYEICKIAVEPQSAEGVSRVTEKISEAISKSLKTKRTPYAVLNEYVNNFIYSECRADNKRVVVFPMAFPQRGSDSKDLGVLPEPSFVGSKVPSHLQAIWTAAYSKFSKTNRKKTEAESIQEAFVDNLPRHVWRSIQMFSVKLTKEERIEAAKDGMWAKEVETKWNSAELKEKVDNDHKSFHPDSDTRDIHEFIHGSVLTTRQTGLTMHSEYIDLVKLAKKFAQGEDTNRHLPSSISIWENFISCSDLVNYADFIGALVVEVSLAMKHKCGVEHALVKQMKFYDVLLCIVPTGSHIFVSCMFYKHSTQLIDTGRIGAKLYDIGNFYVSDPFSVTEVGIEHFAKAGPYMAAILADLLAHFGIDPSALEQKRFFSNDYYPQFWQTLKSIFLCYLNNKLDLEELMTSQRYLYMNLLDDINPDPFRHTGRLPSVLRSRLTVYFTNRMMGIMRHHAQHPVDKRFLKQDKGGETIMFMNLMSLFCQGTVTIEQKICEFYFGYVISKEKGRGSMKSFSICQKLFKEEMKYLNRTGPILSKLDSPSPHRTDIDCLIRVIDCSKKLLEKTLGEDYEEQMEQEIIETMAKTSFSDLATLKASARVHVDKMKFKEDVIESTMSVKELLAELRKDNEEEFRRRPKMLEAIITLVESWSKQHNRVPLHIFELVPYCLEDLEGKNCFDSDLFPKSQHGGDREIHVLEVKARILQFFIEMISRRCCSKFKSEAIMNPAYKDRFVPDHYKAAGVSYDEFVTAGKSADATRWCQNHHVVRFALMLMRMVSPIFHGLIFRVLRLWVKKRINLPMELIAIFEKNKTTKTGSDTFDMMRTMYYSGERPFTAPHSHKIVISSGMFQGILHYTSSLYHTIIQEFNKIVTIQLSMQYLKCTPVVSIIQSSDDTGMLISLPMVKARSSIVEFMYVLMSWKEHFSAYLSVWTSWEKSVMLILCMIEFNSEWSLRQKVIRPRFRWVSACLETSMTDSFIARQRIFSNVLTQAAEGGASTLECSLIQIAQSWMHYKIIGLDTNPLFNAYLRKLLILPDPSLGFFPLDPDLTAGISGYDFSLYLASRETVKMGAHLPIDLVAEVADMLQHEEGEKEESDIRLTEEYKTSDKNKFSSSARLLFNNLEIWKSIVDRTKIQKLEDIIKMVEADPELVYGKKTRWEDDKITLALKMYSPGVKQSLSSHTPLVRMIVSSAYIINRRCLTVRSSKEKLSLYELLCNRISLMHSSNRVHDVERLRMLFPFMDEYENLDQFLREFGKTAVAVEDILSKRSKYKITVFATEEDDFSLVQICRRKWFDHSWLVPVGNQHFEVIWNLTKAKFRFLRDTPAETSLELGLDPVQTRYFLESMGSKSRHVKLTDTPAKGKDLYGVITRIFWPERKIRSAAEPMGQLEISTVRSNLYSMITYMFTPQYIKSQVIKMILGCISLNRAYSTISKENRGLKIIYDYLSGVEKAVIIERLKNMKSGRVGYFSIRQQFNNVLGGYSGPGEWRGVISGVPCVIKMVDKIVVSITLRNVNEIDTLAWMVGSVISDFRLTFPESPVPQHGNVYLTKKNKFVVMRSSPKSMVPVIIDPKLEMSVLDAVSGADWELETTSSSIKIVFKEGGSSRNYTLFSERISPRDWVPTHKYLGESGPMHKAYHSDTPADLKLCVRMINDLVPLSNVSRERRMHMYKTRKSYRNISIPKLTRILLRNAFPNYMSREEENNFASKVKQIKSLHYDISLSQISEMMTEIAEVPIDEEDLMKLRDMVNEEKEDDGDSDDDQEELSSEHSDASVERLLNELPPDLDSIKALDSFLKEIVSSGIAASEYIELQDQLAIGMSTGNNFLSYLSRVCEANVQGYSVKEIFEKDDVKFQGMTGQVLTLITGEDKYLIQAQEEQIIEDLIATPSDYDSDELGSGHTEDRLRGAIDELRGLISNSTGDHKLALIQMLRVREDQLLEIDEDIDLYESNLSVVDIPRPIFMDKFVNLMIDIRKIDDEVLDTLDVIGYNNIVLNMCITKMRNMRKSNELDEAAFSKYTSSLRQSLMSHELLDILAETFYLNIRFDRGGENVYRISAVDRKPAEGQERAERKSTIVFNIDLMAFD